MLVVDCHGDGRRRSGRIALLWKEGCDITITSFCLNHIDVVVKEVSGLEWRFTGIYGHPESGNKEKTVRLLKSS